MIGKSRFTVSLVLALLLALFVSTTAWAHYCTPPNKVAGAGSIGTYNVARETFTPARRNAAHAGFVTITDGISFSYDVFLNQVLPEGALAADPGGDDHCDDRGVDSALACLGISH